MRRNYAKSGILYGVAACLLLTLLGCGQSKDVAVPTEPIQLATRPLSEAVAEVSAQYGLGLKIRDRASLAKESKEFVQQRYEKALDNYFDVYGTGAPLANEVGMEAVYAYWTGVEAAARHAIEELVTYMDVEEDAERIHGACGMFGQVGLDAFKLLPTYLSERLSGLKWEHMLHAEFEMSRKIDVSFLEICAQHYAEGLDYENSIRILEWTLKHLDDDAADVRHSLAGNAPGSAWKSGAGKRALRRELEEKIREYRAQLPGAAAKVAAAEAAGQRFKRYRENPNAPEFEEMNRRRDAIIAAKRQAGPAPKPTVPNAVQEKMEEAEALVEREEFEQAITIWEELGDRERAAESLWVWALALGAKEQRDESLAKWVELAEKYGDTRVGREAKHSLVSQYQSRGEFEKALKALDALGSSDKKAGGIGQDLGLQKAAILLQAQRPQEALEVLKPMRVGLAPGAVSVNLTEFESQCHMRLGQKEQAIAVWQAFIDAVDAGAKITDVGEEEKNFPGTPSPRVTAVSYAERQIAEIKGEVSMEDLRGRPFGIEER